MTPKQKYDERKRLRLERELRDEQRKASRAEREDAAEEAFRKLINSLERIASVVELWADMQKEAGE